MRLRTQLALLSALGFASLSPAHAAPSGSITVSAAASLKDVLSSLGGAFQKQHPGTKIRFNFAGSGSLRTQIEAGAPVDVFIPADDKNMNALASQKLIDVASRRVLAGNRLVLIVPSDSRTPIKSFRDLAKGTVQRVAIGAPSVPAGDRAREVLNKLGISHAVEAKAVRSKDVREVLAQVETGNVEAGIVYRTDALTSSRVKIVATAPSQLHAPIRYPGAILDGASNPSLAAQFLAFLGSKTAKFKFKSAGFVTS